LNGEAVRAALPVDDAIEAVRAAYIACSTGHGAAPERVALDLPGDRNVALFMPGFMDAANCRSLVIKTVTVFPANPQRGLPMNQGALLAIDPGTGAACGLLDTATVTAIRTAAGSAVATDCLARSDATSLRMRSGSPNASDSDTPTSRSRSCPQPTMPSVVPTSSAR
jgi:ornithine cyclodeaminase